MHFNLLCLFVFRARAKASFLFMLLASPKQKPDLFIRLRLRIKIRAAFALAFLLLCFSISLQYVLWLTRECMYILAALLNQIPNSSFSLASSMSVDVQIGSKASTLADRVASLDFIRLPASGPRGTRTHSLWSTRPCARPVPVTTSYIRSAALLGSPTDRLARRVST